MGSAIYVSMRAINADQLLHQLDTGVLYQENHRAAWYKTVFLDEARLVEEYTSPIFGAPYYDVGYTWPHKILRRVLRVIGVIHGTTARFSDGYFTLTARGWERDECDHRAPPGDLISVTLPTGCVLTAVHIHNAGHRTKRTR